MLPANDFVGANQQATAAAVLGVAREEYTLAGGRSGTAGLTPAQIQEKAEAASERGRTTQVPAPIASRFLLCLTMLPNPFLCCPQMTVWVQINRQRRPQRWGWSAGNTSLLGAGLVRLA